MRTCLLLLAFAMGAAPHLAGAEDALPRPIRVGVNLDYPPFESVDAAGKPQGYDVDLIEAVGRVMGLELRIVPGRWNQVREDFAQGRLDLLPGLLKSEAREAWASFSEPHLVVHYSLFTRKEGAHPHSVEELRGRKVLVEEGSQMHEQLLQAGLGPEIVPVASEPEALRQLAAGRCDAALVPHLEGQLQLRNSQLTNIRPGEAPLFSRELCFAVGKDNPELRSRLNTGLAILHRTGEYQRIYRKWFGALEGEGPSRALRWAAWVLLPLAGGLLVVLAWNGILGLRVHRATSQLQEANRSLRSQERMLNAVIDSLPLMLFVKDPTRDYRFTVWNRKTAELLGVPRETMIGATDGDLLPPENATRFREADERVIRTGERMDIPEETVLSPVRGPVLLRTIKVPVLDEEGRPRFLLGISEDITQLKRTEAILAQSRESLAEAQRVARLGSWEWHPETGKVDWSEELFRLLDEVPGARAPAMDRFVEAIHPEDRGAFEVLLDAAKAPGEPKVLDHRLQAGDGPLRHVHSRVECRQVPGEEGLSLLGTCQDVTEARRAEEAFRQTQKLESLGVLAGGVAHDFNNLLSAALGHLNLAQAGLPPEDPAGASLEKAETALLRAAQLTRQILAYSGRGSFLVKALDLNALVEEMAGLLRVSVSKKVRLLQDLAPGLPAVHGDESQLQQLVLNLVTNASEAIGDEEGSISLSTRMVRLGQAEISGAFPGQALAEGPYLRLEVRDSGCGIPPEILDRIFEPFFTTKFHGRGLGLSAMLGILKGHRAGLQVESWPKQGSAFRIFLPAGEAPAPEAQGAPEAALPALEGKVLVVDDEALLRASACELFHHLGFPTLEAEDGLEAVALFRAHASEILLVLLDLTMPRMNGREALKEIKAIDPAARVVLCSGFDQQEALAGSEAKSVAGFLAKPYRLRDLQALLGRVLGPSGT